MFLLEVAQAFNHSKISYALVGGYAVALHGAVRGTIDIDLVIRLTEKDFIAAEKALQALGLVSRIPVDAKQVFQFREEYIQNRNLIAWSFSDPRRPIRQVDIIIAHGLKLNEIEKIELYKTPVAILSKKALIKMKQKSGRAQDLEDILALKKLISKPTKKGPRS